MSGQLDIIPAVRSIDHPSPNGDAFRVRFHSPIETSLKARIRRRRRTHRRPFDIPGGDGVRSPGRTDRRLKAAHIDRHAARAEDNLRARRPKQPHVGGDFGGANAKQQLAKIAGLPGATDSLPEKGEKCRSSVRFFATRRERAQFLLASKIGFAQRVRVLRRSPTQRRRRLMSRFRGWSAVTKRNLESSISSTDHISDLFVSTDHISDLWRVGVLSFQAATEEAERLQRT